LESEWAMKKLENLLPNEKRNKWYYFGDQTIPFRKISLVLI
jgi:hypothetical protein